MGSNRIDFVSRLDGTGQDSDEDLEQMQRIPVDSIPGIPTPEPREFDTSEPSKSSNLEAHIEKLSNEVATLSDQIEYHSDEKLRFGRSTQNLMCQIAKHLAEKADLQKAKVRLEEDKSAMALESLG